MKTNVVIPETMEDFNFPVSTNRIAYGLPNGLWGFTDKFKAVIREDNEEIISIVSPTYKLVSNKDLIDTCLETLSKTDIPFNLHIGDKAGKLMNFVTSQRMKLTISFPEMKIYDGEEGVEVCAFLENSYNSSQAINFQIGLLRLICTNGATSYIARKMLRFKHVESFQLEYFKQGIDNLYMKIPEIKERVEILHNIHDRETMNNIIEKAGKENKKLGEHCLENDPANMWELYNALTFFITHNLAVRRQTAYFNWVAKQFQL